MATSADKTRSTKEWLPIPGYEGLYEVSKAGQVRSLDRVVLYPNEKPPRFFKGKILKQSLM